MYRVNLTMSKTRTHITLYGVACWHVLITTKPVNINTILNTIYKLNKLLKYMGHSQKMSTFLWLIVISLNTLLTCCEIWFLTHIELKKHNKYISMHRTKMKFCAQIPHNGPISHVISPLRALVLIDSLFLITKSLRL